MKKLVYSIIFALLLMELVSRIGIAVVLGVPILQSGSVEQRFYPELKRAGQYAYDDQRMNVLVLGGSVLYRDTLVVYPDGIERVTLFCDPARALPADRYNVLNLAEPGHNSMDSYHKYRFLGGRARFDAVFVYHGINDTRTNNIAAEAFDPDYRHVEFYDDLYILDRHPERKYYTTPFMIDWMVHSVRKQHKDYIPRELFPGLLHGDPEPGVLAGDHTLSEGTFDRNLRAIVRLAAKRKEAPVLSTYAWYLPDNYTLSAFNRGELDYSESIYPTELYGLPAHVVRGLGAHNAAVRRLAAETGLPLVEAYERIPQEGLYFNDICHLSPQGCAVLCRLLQEALESVARDQGRQE